MPMTKQDLYRSIAFPTAYTLEEERKAQEIKDRSDREKTALTMYPKLIEQYTPEETDSIMRRFIEGEGINTPTMRGQLLPPPGKGDTDPYSPQNITFNEGGRAVRGSTLEPIKFKPSNAENIDLNVYDEETGTVTNKGKIAKDSRVITTRKEKPLIDRDKAQRFQLFKEKGKLRDLMVAQGMDTSQVDAELETMAPEFGYSYEELVKDPTWWQKLTGKEPESTKTLKRDGQPKQMVRIQENKKTGQRRQSTDGGKTWQSIP